MMRSKKEWTFVLFTLVSTVGLAQPSTEVYLMDLKLGDVPTISNPINISNNDGYDNQPSFWPDGKSILYARTIEWQTEIARYFIETKKTEVITNTYEGSEYSPTPTPDGNISSIRLDTSGLQLLYSYDLDGNYKVLVPELVIGYHSWINEDEIVSFVLGEPATMQIVNTKTTKSRKVAENIGRSLHKIPNRDAFSYVDKSNSEWSINAMDSEGNIDRLIGTLEGAEDYCWTPSGNIIMGQGSKLFYWEDGSEWKEIGDMASYELGTITRMTVSPDGTKLVVVVNN